MKRDFGPDGGCGFLQIYNDLAWNAIKMVDIVFIAETATDYKEAWWSTGEASRDSGKTIKKGTGSSGGQNTNFQTEHGTYADLHQ